MSNLQKRINILLEKKNCPQESVKLCNLFAQKVTFPPYKRN